MLSKSGKSLSAGSTYREAPVGKHGSAGFKRFKYNKEG